MIKIKAVQISKGQQIQEVEFDPATVRREGRAVDYVSFEPKAVAIYTLPDAQGALEPAERFRRLLGYGASFVVTGVNDRGDLVDLSSQASSWLKKSIAGND